MSGSVPAPADDLLAFLAEEGQVRQASDGRWYWSSENFPASEISLRTAAPENVVIIDTTPDRPRVLGEVDLFSAQVLVHERAIYIHESVQYYVDRLEWGERKAYVHRVDVDHYTYANRAVTLKPLEIFAEAPAVGGRRIHGEVMVASLVTLFKKLKFLTDENVGWGPIDLPELELQTTAYWLTAEAARPHWRRDELDIALLGAGRAIQTVAAIAPDGRPARPRPGDPGPLTALGSSRPSTCTRRSRGVSGSPSGCGTATRELLSAAAGLIAACGCDLGCPACTGPRLEPDVDARALALRLLAELGRAGRARPRPLRTTVIDGTTPARAAGSSAIGRRPDRRRRASRREGRDDLAARLAAAVDGEVVRGPEGIIVRRDTPSRPLPVDRRRLAALPGQPPPDVPLVCLDTETTGLATAAGTMAFLIGLGWWEAESFRQVQLLLPDHGEERALLTALEAAIPTLALARHLQRTRLRLAAADGPLPDGPPGRAAATPAISTSCPSSAGCSGTGWPTPGCGRPRPSSSGMHRRRRRRRLGDPRPLPPLPRRRAGHGAGRGRPPQRPGRPLARAG